MSTEEFSREIAVIEGTIAEETQEVAESHEKHIVETEIVEEVFQDGELVEVVVIEEFAKRGEKPPRAKTYVVRITSTNQIRLARSFSPQLGRHPPDTSCIRSFAGSSRSQ
jgi:uncharacterized Fe-S cluster-containing radical SAM superfamily enzyme